jgi:hypothetical protein
MRIPKTYGKSKDSDCPFCGTQTTCENPQGIAVCKNHKEQRIDEVKCICGSWLEARSGKFGRYYNCINCGNVNQNKVEQIKEMTSPTLQPDPIRLDSPISTPVIAATERDSPKKEITISSRDMDYFD